jgi:hypothetical protein
VSKRGFAPSERLQILPPEASVFRHLTSRARCHIAQGE